MTNPQKIEIRRLLPEDPQIFSSAFAKIGWNKSVAKYENYLRDQAEGVREVFVAEASGDFAGYVTVEWESKYPPFADSNIPEVVDLNVLPRFRRQGIGTALLDAAEAKIAERSDVAGIGVGMTADYGQAQRMYSRRGYVPDGRGLTQDRQTVKFRQPIVVDDSTALWFTKELRDE